MPSHRPSWCPILCVGLLMLPGPGSASQPDDSVYRRTIERVLKLLPTQPVRVVVVDADRADGDVRESLRRMEAFITKGGRNVYLTRHSAVLQGALKEWTLHEHILAAIIWHETAHIEGADEIEAQRREEALLTNYIMAERVDRGDGSRYLATLKSRRGKDGRLTQERVAETLNGPLLERAIAVVDGRQVSKDVRENPGRR
jgi:hypothetical protein